MRAVNSCPKCQGETECTGIESGCYYYSGRTHKPINEDPPAMYNIEAKVAANGVKERYWKPSALTQLLGSYSTLELAKAATIKYGDTQGHVTYRIVKHTVLCTLKFMKPKAGTWEENPWEKE